MDQTYLSHIWVGGDFVAITKPVTGRKDIYSTAIYRTLIDEYDPESPVDGVHQSTKNRAVDMHKKVCERFEGRDAHLENYGNPLGNYERGLDAEIDRIDSLSRMRRSIDEKSKAIVGDRIREREMAGEGIIEQDPEFTFLLQKELSEMEED